MWLEIFKQHQTEKTSLYKAFTENQILYEC